MSICEPKKTELAAENNRAAFPETAKIVDAFRKEFGSDQVKLICSQEGGRTLGKIPPQFQRFMTVEQWLKGSEMIERDRVRREAAMFKSGNRK